MIISLADNAAKASGRTVAPGGTNGILNFTGCHLHDDDRSTSRARANSPLKVLLRQELLRQTGMRLPETYANLTGRVGLAGIEALDVIRSLLEGLMEDDADRDSHSWRRSR